MDKLSLKGYISRRAFDSGLLLVITVVFNFVLFRIMPGNPALAVLGRTGQVRPEFRQALQERYGTNLPIFDQFIIYIQRLLEGDLGVSFYYYPTEVSDLIFGHRLFNTIILMGVSILISFVLALIFGTIAASKFKSKTDLLAIFVTLTSYSTPVFWLGMLIIFYFFGQFHLIPLSGSPRIDDPKYADFFAWLLDYIYHMIGPVTTLTISFVGAWFLIARDQMLGVFIEDYITTARAKGLKERRVLFTHARKNAMLPMISVLAMAMTYLVSGATLTETVFSWDGLGLLTFDAVTYSDYPLLQGLFLLVAGVAIISSFLADILYAYLDPRIRY